MLTAGGGRVSRRGIFRGLILAGMLFFLLPAPVISQSQDELPIVAVILDDLGYNRARGERANRLPPQVALSVLPHSPFGPDIAVEANRQGRLIMMHCPMESLLPYRLGPGGLQVSMDEREFLETLADNLASIPYVSGVNNHMGSLLTSNHQKMGWVMSALRDTGGLFYVDSRTTAQTVAEERAEEFGIPNLRRDVFLDNRRDVDYIRGQMLKLVKKARRNGSALAIGHPYPQTLEVLEEMLPELIHHGVRLVPVSELLEHKNRSKPLWQAYLSPSHKVVKNSKPLLSSTCCEEPVLR